MATLVEIDPIAEPATPNLHNSSSQDNEIEVVASSSTAEPPPYSRNAAPDDPFRDYANSNGMQKGLKRVATEPTLPTTTTLIGPLPAVSTDMVLDDGFLPPPLPYRPPSFSRGLQIPSRVSLITWGFTFPKVLLEQGVNEEQWRLFKHELETFASLTISQHFTVAGCGFLIGYFLGLLPGAVVGSVVCWNMRKHREHANFDLAYRGGALKTFEDRWNNSYFHPLGLHVHIVPPGIGQLDGMDVASSKLYKYQQKVGISSPAAGVASNGGDKKEYRYQYKESRHRMKATRKGRIIILPWKPVDALPVQPRITGSEGVYRGPSRSDTKRTPFPLSPKH